MHAVLHPSAQAALIGDSPGGERIPAPRRVSMAEPPEPLRAGGGGVQAAEGELRLLLCAGQSPGVEAWFAFGAGDVGGDEGCSWCMVRGVGGTAERLQVRSEHHPKEAAGWVKPTRLCSACCEQIKERKIEMTV